MTPNPARAIRNIRINTDSGSAKMIGSDRRDCIMIERRQNGKQMDEVGFPSEKCVRFGKQGSSAAKMTEMNPYEAPQTLDKPLPMANEVFAPSPPSPPTKEGLVTGLRRLSEAGRIIVFSALGCILSATIVHYSQGIRGFRREMIQVAFIFCAATTAVTFAWGYFKNLFAYNTLIKQSTEQAFQKLYSTCQIHTWIRLVGGVLVFLLMPAINPQPNELRFIIALGALALVSLIHSVILHHQAFRWWSKRLNMNVASGVSRLFIVAGVSGAILIFCGSAYFFEYKLAIAPWFIALTAVVLGIALAAYARIYRQLANALASESADEFLLTNAIETD